MSEDPDVLLGLMRVMTPPSSPIDVEGRSWADLENELGISLPADYKAFIEVYGTGIVNNLLIPINPRSSAVEWSFQQVDEILEASYTSRENRPHAFPYPLYPEPAGLLPWGYTENGDTCFWQTDPTGRPDEWSMVVLEVRGAGFANYEGSFTELLLDLLTERIAIGPVFGENFADWGPSFRPAPG